LAKGLSGQFAKKNIRTLCRYAQMIKAFMICYGEPLDDLTIKVPKSIPKYTDDSTIQKVSYAIQNKKPHKKIIPRDLLLWLDERRRSARELSGDYFERNS
jgi:hypothetical protein